MRRKSTFDDLVIINLDNQKINLMYDTSQLLGEGKYAKVCYGFECEPYRCIALKIQTICSQSTSVINRKLANYQKELEVMTILTKADAPNVVKLYGTIGQMVSPTVYEVFIAMTYAAKGALSYWLKDGFIMLTDNQKMKITHGIVSGLRAMHAVDIIHRDLKTANIVLDECFNPMICDFGLSMRSVDRNYSSGGTPCYMSPAMLLALYTHYEATPSKKDDIYSLSLVIWCIYAKNNAPFKHITEKNPLIGKKGLLIKVGIQSERLPVPPCPSNIRQLIQLGWDANPKQRPTAEQALEILNPLRKTPEPSLQHATQAIPAITVRRSKSFSGKKHSSIRRSCFFAEKIIHSQDCLENEKITRKRLC